MVPWLLILVPRCVLRAGFGGGGGRKMIYSLENVEWEGK